MGRVSFRRLLPWRALLQARAPWDLPVSGCSTWTAGYDLKLADHTKCLQRPPPAFGAAPRGYTSWWGAEGRRGPADWAPPRKNPSEESAGDVGGRERPSEEEALRSSHQRVPRAVPHFVGLVYVLHHHHTYVIHILFWKRKLLSFPIQCLIICLPLHRTTLSKGVVAYVYY